MEKYHLILIIPILATLGSWYYTGRMTRIPGKYVKLIYNPETGPMIYSTIRQLRMILAVAAALVSSLFSYAVIDVETFFVRATDDENGNLLWFTLFAFPVAIGAYVPLILMPVMKHFVYFRFRKIVDLNPEQAEKIEGLAKAIVRQASSGKA